MRYLARYLALAACLAFTGSIAVAEAESSEIKLRKNKKKKKKQKKRNKTRRATGARIAFAADDGDLERVDRVDAPARLHRRAGRSEDWRVAIGPYLWASSVDADVSLGAQSVGAGVDFLDLKRHAKYGVPVVAEVRYRRFSFNADFMYGVIGISGGTELGPIMVKVDGTASSLLFDGFAGYRVFGDDQSALAIDARGGIRYQRTAINGSYGIGDMLQAAPESVAAGSDGLVGARVSLRPLSRLQVSGEADARVFGASAFTWSASAEASVRITSHVVLSLGWRTLTKKSPIVSLVMHGPRAALQLVF